MKLKDIFDQLSYNEISLLSVGGEDQGVISEKNYPQLVAHVNLGLTALFKRFNLKEGEVSLYLFPTIEHYLLDSRFLIGNTRSREPVRYLKDSLVQPFKDDLLKVERVFVDSGYWLPLNDKADALSVHTPRTKLLTVPKDIITKSNDLPSQYKTSQLKLVYRANHPQIKIPLGYFDPARVEVELPDSYMEALLYFIAARINTPKGLTEEGNIGNNWYAKYETECQRLEEQNLEIDQGVSNTRLIRAGWV